MQLYNLDCSLNTKTVLTLQRLSPLHLDRTALSLRWLVVLLMLFGTLAMPTGSTISHGIAAVAQSLSATTSLTGIQQHNDHDHDHHHEAADSSTVGHAHHGADHSHDPAHAPVTAWTALAPQLARWLGQPLRWVETVQQSRLERPPIV